MKQVNEYTKNKIVDIAQKYPDIQRVVLFGLRARGDHRANSDIDVGVYMTKGYDTWAFGLFCNEIDEIETLLKTDVVVDGGLSDNIIMNIAKEGVCIMDRFKDKFLYKFEQYQIALA